jgi:hypothetical protein
MLIPRRLVSRRRYNSCMRCFDSGRVPWRIILIQAAILAGLVAFFKVYLPHFERERAARAAAERERRIEAFFPKAVVEDTTHEVAVPLDGAIVKRHPQRLRATLSVEDVEAQLGAPDVSTTDFRGGQHLTWIGATHKILGSFNAGRLYCLTYEDRSSGHGVMVYDSIWSWHPY